MPHTHLLTCSSLTQLNILDSVGGKKKLFSVRKKKIKFFLISTPSPPSCYLDANQDEAEINQGQPLWQADASLVGTLNNMLSLIPPSPKSTLTTPEPLLLLQPVLSDCGGCSRCVQHTGCIHLGFATGTHIFNLRKSLASGSQECQGCCCHRDGCR